MSVVPFVAWISGVDSDMPCLFGHTPQVWVPPGTLRAKGHCGECHRLRNIQAAQQRRSVSEREDRSWHQVGPEQRRLQP